jgi:hypothetical protein
MFFFDRWLPARAGLSQSLSPFGGPPWFLRYKSCTIVYEWCFWRRELTGWWIFRHPPWRNLSPQQYIGRIVMALRKVAVVPGQPARINDPATAKRLPTLWEHLTSRSYDSEGKEPRLTSTISLFCRDDGTLGAVLNDKDNGRVCFAAGDTLTGLLDGLEAVAANPLTVWREDKNQTGSSKRKR